MAADGVSVLSAMSKAAVEQAAKATGPKPTLTVLPSEQQTTSVLSAVTTPAPFPFDVPVETLLRIIADLERQRDALNGVIDGLRLAAGDPIATTEQAAKEAAQAQQAAEREADRRATDRAAAEAGDKRAAARVEKETPMDTIVKAAEAATTKAEMMTAALEGEDFPARFQRLKEEAQAAVYTPVETSNGPVAFNVLAAAARGEPDTTADGWTCPIHGQAVEKISARRNRAYRACPEEGCAEFEKL